MTRQEYCVDCRRAQSQMGEKIRCTECGYRCPELLQENAEAYSLWQQANTQWRVGFSGIIGLDYNALFSVAEVLDIEEVSPGLFWKLRELEKLTLKISREEVGDVNG